MEEVPARMIAGAEAELLRRTVALFEREGLLVPGVVIGETGARSFSTPRRLAVLVKDVLERQPDATEEINGPATKIAFRDGQPTAAAEAFARKAGVSVAQLKTVTTAKGEYLQAAVTKAGRSAAEVIAAELPREIAAIYWAKSMYWLSPTGHPTSGGNPVRAGKPERFVRPVEWIVCLLDDRVVPLQFGGRAAGHVSYGHRVLSTGQPSEIVVPESYLAQLRGEYVMADAEARRYAIRKELDRVVRTIEGARWREDEALVDTVTHLTEWPTVLLGSFGEEFLELPEEVLVTVMRDHQKYFAVEDKAGKLLPYFLTVLNIELDETNAGIIRQGNERVLRARFNDARFFWQVDRRISLMDRAALLENVTFHKDLGSYAAKTARMLALARRLADVVTAQGTHVDTAALEQAVTLAKSDLTTELVKEFTELQGMIGGLYARAEGASERVSEVIYDQYMPAGSEGRVPRSVEGALLGIADRADTLAGLFRLGLEPTGSKDPFALRRAANAIVKILAEMELPLTLENIVKHAAANEAVAERLRTFFTERLSFYLREVRGFAYDVVTAVLGPDAENVRDAVARAEAVGAMRDSADFLAVSAAFKRMRNILEQAILEQAIPEHAILEQAAAMEGNVAAGTSEVAEQAALAAKAYLVGARVNGFVAKREYRSALERMATLRPEIDAFFDKVMVMDPDPELRAGRLRLLAQIVRSFSGIADFAEIVTVG